MEDAVRGGCNLFDLDQLRMEYSPDEYQNLLMCEFVDDLASVFPLSELQACMVDSWEVWTDFHALALRPFGWREVWIGYDPAKGTQNGDSAGCVVVAPPAVPCGKFRILERYQWRGMDFRAGLTPSKTDRTVQRDLYRYRLDRCRSRSLRERESVLSCRPGVCLQPQR